ncbi:putative Polyprotein [Cucumis melo var. makuwa]|uniref:Polyprotein n=1 Tax=Cucumis melo var. makuwa TaxID=1194695 RepID=A0A5D3CBN0_CUCMM|nr:putative Polyprotein [Cucumis melo var. makuwa]TYK09397.1 putative Polyprotein [Cucumis melo var. makuwa]
MDDHMTEDAPEDAKKKKDWLRDDVHLYLQIKNSIESEIIGLVDHSEFVTNYFMRLKKITAELALLLPFSPDVKVQQAQREKMVVMIFLNGLLAEFGMAKAQILSDSKILSDWCIYCSIQ